jgi:cytoskeletal protein RodZ
MTTLPLRRISLRPVLIAVAVILVAALIGFLVWRSHTPGQSAPATTPTASALPSSAASSDPADPDASDPVAEDASPTLSEQQTAFKQRVQQFEEAYAIKDPAVRNTKLSEFVTSGFMDDLKVQEASEAEDDSPGGRANRNLQVRIDWDSSSIVPEGEHGDPHLIHVVSSLKTTTAVRDNVPNESLVVTHRTSWSDEVVPGVWLAALDNDRPVDGGNG